MQRFQDATGSMQNGKTYPLFANNWITSYYYFLSAKKKFYAVIRIEKFYGPLCSISRKMFLIHSQYLIFDPLRNYSIVCEKPLLADLLKNRLHYMHENLNILRS